MNTGNLPRPGRWWALLVGVLLLLAVAVAVGWPGPIVAVDVEQSRLDVALPIPTDQAPITQTFRPGHTGFNEVELLLAAHGEAAPGGELHLQLRDGAGHLVAGRILPAAELAHNDPVTLRFPPQSDPAGGTYTLWLGGNAQNTYSVWGYSLDVLDGTLTLPGQGAVAQELRFTTRYRLTWGGALAELGRFARDDGPFMLLALAYTLLPGCLLLLLARRRLPRLDPAAWWGVALALGVAAWPALWQWLTLASGRWTGWVLWGVLIVGWGTVIGWRVAGGKWQVARPSPPHPHTPTPPHSTSLHWQHALLLLLLAAALAVRLLAVRDLAFPPWVDASRHALITRIMANTGQTPSGYAPYLPVDYFPYHFGFHTLPAGLQLLYPRSLPRTLLVLGQLLNALVPLTVYAAGWLLARRRDVALLAAFLVALPFFFPGYYATWGRFTQLTAVLVLPVLLALTWRLVRGARGWRSGWWLIGVLAAGLFFIHVRVFLLYVPFAALVWGLGRGRQGRRLAAATGLALLFVAPRLVALAGYARATGVLQDAAPGYNDFPTGYLTVGWERAYLVAAGLALLAALIAFLWRRRWGVLPLALAGWMGVVGLLLSGRVPGLGNVWLINLNSAYIVAFLPLALVLALVAGRVGRWWMRRHWAIQLAGWVPAGAILAALLLFGVHQQITILNPTTILARPGDAAGLAWVRENVPPSGKVAVNAWQWLGKTWAGSDGGAWVLPLADPVPGRVLSTTTPPVDHIYNRDLFLEVIAFNEAAQAVNDWSTPDAAGWLRAQGVTHVFVGARGGFFDPAELARNPELEMVHGREGVFVFALTDS